MQINCLFIVIKKSGNVSVLVQQLDIFISEGTHSTEEDSKCYYLQHHLIHISRKCILNKGEMSDIGYILYLHTKSPTRICLMKPVIL